MDISGILVILIVCIALIMTLLILFTKDIFIPLNKSSKVLRWFIAQNSGFFKLFFIILFFLEQVIFIFVLDRYFNISKEANTFIGIFALIVVTTASFQVFIWEHKYYQSIQQLKIVKYINLLTEKYENIIDRFKTALKKK